MYIVYTILFELFWSLKLIFIFLFSNVTSGCYNRIGFTINFIVYGSIWVLNHSMSLNSAMLVCLVFV